MVALLEQGHTLHSGHFGMWTMNPIDAQCSDVNQHTARALVARKLVRRVEGDRWEATPNTELATTIECRCWTRWSSKTHISGKGLTYTARAWYVRKDGKLHGQFSTENEAVSFAAAL